jgi:alpha-D-ribose 1-methylphosphonate 5-triphosphate synthase subunit PhnH
VTSDPKLAVFAILDATEVLAHIDHFSIGTDEYPDRSAILIVQSGTVQAQHQVDASGPGLKMAVPFGCAGTDRAFWQRLQMNAALFPLGLDFIFASPGAIASLPRSTHVSLKETG